MNLVRPYAKLVGVPDQAAGIQLLKKIEWCARISHRSEDAVTDTSWDRFIRAVVLGHGDWSVVEHASATVDAVMDRGITHEWVRHRLFSFTQESTRFVNYDKKMPPAFICPFEYTLNELSGEAWPTNPDDNLALAHWLHLISHSEDAYKKILAAGKPPQIGRSVFPNALASRIATTGNLRNWRHFFIMRTTLEAHPQMKEISIPLLAEFQEKIPILFEDIIPNSKQTTSMAKLR